MFYFNKIYIKNAQVLLSTGEKSIQDQETIEDEAKTGRKKKGNLFLKTVTFLPSGCTEAFDLSG